VKLHVPLPFPNRFHLDETLEGLRPSSNVAVSVGRWVWELDEEVPTIQIVIRPMRHEAGLGAHGGEEAFT
jgi:hypothetical protein